MTCIFEIFEFVAHTYLGDEQTVGQVGPSGLTYLTISCVVRWEWTVAVVSPHGDSNLASDTAVLPRGLGSMMSFSSGFCNVSSASHNVQYPTPVHSQQPKVPRDSPTARWADMAVRCGPASPATASRWLTSWGATQDENTPPNYIHGASPGAKGGQRQGRQTERDR